MTRTTNGRGGAWVAALLVAIGFAALLATGCSDQSSSSSSSSSGGGTHGLSDTAYWEGKFANGWTDSVDSVVKKGKTAVPLLMKLLQSSNETVVSTAAMALNDLGADGSAAMPALLDALKNFPDQPDVVSTLKKHYLVEAVPDLIAWLKGSNPKLQAQAAKLMNGKKLGEAGDQAIPVLLDILKGSAPDKVKIEAMGAIGSFGIAADARARPVLEGVVAAGGTLKEYAARAIKRLDSAQVMHEIRTGQR